MGCSTALKGMCFWFVYCLFCYCLLLFVCFSSCPLRCRTSDFVVRCKCIGGIMGSVVVAPLSQRRQTEQEKQQQLKMFTTTRCRGDDQQQDDSGGTLCSTGLRGLCWRDTQLSMENWPESVQSLLPVRFGTTQIWNTITVQLAKMQQLQG